MTTSVPPVLRNVVVQERPHTLARPHRGAPAARGDADAYEEGLREGLRRCEATMNQQREQARLAHDAQVEEDRRAGFEQGRTEGREEGLRESREEAARETQRLQTLREQLEADAARKLRERMQQIEREAARLNAQAAEALAAAEDDMVSLVLESVSRIVASPAVTRELTARVLRRLIAERQPLGPLRVHVHPGELEHVRTQFDSLVDACWVADESVAAGCVVHTERGRLDARAETQLARLRDALVQARCDPARGGEQP
ncbi:MAG TPA: FliH/SctL family protein [Ramlibacter sp.]|uniref:FliH/SctL family protein n=1 Tax=Ramlibacter sp. TaxID=1917967 RepID=UPI002C80406E|nr:FliH/SctL family protein [Ramlibacter sp.]HVZ46121.1 FliH/SctL family protein [Ramlibacter sp.]